MWSRRAISQRHHLQHNKVQFMADYFLQYKTTTENTLGKSQGLGIL
ncbi:mCG1037868 [Mus musculus]|nr:mCG1037868 [Mus musculus]